MPEWQNQMIIPVTNRTFVLPAGFAPPGSNLVITASPKRCLLVYSPERWAKVRRQLELKLSPQGLSPALWATLRRLVIGYSSEEDVGSDNKIQLRCALADYAGIKETLLWLPREESVELWNPDAFYCADTGTA